MTDHDVPPSEKQRLREEAADWFAAMRGPDARACGAEFDRWLARSPAHREAYNRIAETFSLGKGLKAQTTESREGKTLPQRHRRGRLVRLAQAGGICSATILTVFLLVPKAINDPNRTAPAQSNRDALTIDASAQLATRIGEIRTFRLSDGSFVTLDTNSRLSVLMTGAKRELRLERGRVRFSVAHESRPFVVMAGGGTVTAHGTVFDVDMSRDGKVAVHLLRGAVDVDLPAETRMAKRPDHTKRLSPGAQIAFSHGQFDNIPVTDTAINGDWTSAIRDFDQISLRDLLAETNRYTSTPITLASPELGRLRVSGTMRPGDPRALARNIADLLDLDVTISASSIVLSRHCPSARPENCRPPS